MVRSAARRSCRCGHDSVDRRVDNSCTSTPASRIPSLTRHHAMCVCCGNSGIRNPKRDGLMAPDELVISSLLTPWPYHLVSQRLVTKRYCTLSRLHWIVYCNSLGWFTRMEPFMTRPLGFARCVRMTVTEAVSTRCL